MKDPGRKFGSNLLFETTGLRSGRTVGSPQWTKKNRVSRTRSGNVTGELREWRRVIRKNDVQCDN